MGAFDPKGHLKITAAASRPTSLTGPSLRMPTELKDRHKRDVFVLGLAKLDMQLGIDIEI